MAIEIDGQWDKRVTNIFKCVSIRSWMLNMLLLAFAVFPCSAQTQQLASQDQRGSLSMTKASPKDLYLEAGKVFGIKVSFDPKWKSNKLVNLELNDVTARVALDSIANLTETSWEVVGPNDVFVTAGQPFKFRKFTADFGGGLTWSQGGGLARGINFRGGGGVRLSPQSKRYSDIGDRLRQRHWSLYLDGEFTFIQAGLTQDGLHQAILVNPALASATSGTANYYSVTADPNFRYCVWSCRLTFYVLGGFGWMHRTVEFSGPPTGTSPVGSGKTVATFDYNSAAYDVGGGVTFGPFKPTEGVTYYVEARRLAGFGPNGASTLWPLSFGIRW